MLILVQVACGMTIRPVRSQISGAGLLVSREALAERRRVSHVFEAAVVRVVVVKNLVGLHCSKQS